MVTVKIRTTDAAWASKRGLKFENEGKGDGAGLVAVQVPSVQPVTFAGRDMVRFDLGTDLPRDYPNRWVLTPAGYVANR